MSELSSLAPSTVDGPMTWSAALALPELTELRRRRRRVTMVMGILTFVLFGAFIVCFAGFPEELGRNTLFDIPLSLWIVFSQFVGTWLLVYAYFHLSRAYLRPATQAALDAVSVHTKDIK